MERSAMIPFTHADVSSLRVLIAVLIVVNVVTLLPLALASLLSIYRRNARSYQSISNNGSIELMEPNMPAGLGIRHSPNAEQNPEVIRTRASAETILSPTSPSRPLLAASQWPIMSAPGPNNNILDRRGKSPLMCDTTALYAIDAALTGSIMPKSCPAKRLRLSPMYGFDEASITPPIGSPLWRWKPDSAGVAESPKSIMRSKLSTRGPDTFSESTDRPQTTQGDQHDSAVTATVLSPFDAGRVSSSSGAKISNDT